MQKFGYLKESAFHPNDSSSALLSENSVRSGIKSLQQFAGLPVTGILDDSTKKVGNASWFCSYNYKMF